MPKKDIKLIVISAAVLFVLFVFSGGVFIVEEGEQAIITQFGRPIGDSIVDSGLHFKVPFVQDLHFFEKRLIRWDGSPNQVPTKDKKYIWIDTTARWRIADALKFMQSVGTEDRAQSRLDDIIDSVVRDNISSNILIGVVRSTKDSENNHSEGDKWKAISVGRKEIIENILSSARKISREYGIEIVDFRIKRINYVKSVQKKVYERMISERRRIAAEFRAQGEGRKSEILGKMERELDEIKSIAYRQSETNRGKADAYVTKMFGEAFNQDPEFYAFVKTLDTYKKLVGSNLTMILSTESEFFKYMDKP